MDTLAPPFVTNAYLAKYSKQGQKEQELTPHCPKINLILSLKTETATGGAEVMVFITYTVGIWHKYSIPKLLHPSYHW